MADATIECRFDGRDVSVVISNDTGRAHDFEYECKWSTETGTHTARAKKFIHDGEEVEVHAGRAESKVTGVIGKTLIY